MKSVFPYLTVCLLMGLITFSGCGDDDVASEDNQGQIITDVTLSFTDPDGGSLEVTASDSDGLAPGTTVTGDIRLDPNTVYVLSVTLENKEDPGNVENITQRIQQQDNEYMLFFGWTGQMFDSPTGLGNIGAGNRSNNVNYQDQDENGQPLGLTTIWNTGTETASGDFRVILKHQPGVKSATSSSADGETTIDLTFFILVE